MVPGTWYSLSEYTRCHYCDYESLRIGAMGHDRAAEWDGWAFLFTDSTMTGNDDCYSTRLITTTTYGIWPGCKSCKFDLTLRLYTKWLVVLLFSSASLEQAAECSQEKLPKHQNRVVISTPSHQPGSQDREVYGTISLTPSMPDSIQSWAPKTSLGSWDTEITSSRPGRTGQKNFTPVLRVIEYGSQDSKNKIKIKRKRTEKTIGIIQSCHESIAAPSLDSIVNVFECDTFVHPFLIIFADVLSFPIETHQIQLPL